MTPAWALSKHEVEEGQLLDDGRLKDTPIPQYNWKHKSFCEAATTFAKSFDPWLDHIECNLDDFLYAGCKGLAIIIPIVSGFRFQSPSLSSQLQNDTYMRLVVEPGRDIPSGGFRRRA